MAHFAELNEKNIVTRVIVVSNEILKNSDGIEVEQNGIDFCKENFEENTIWKQTSYNNNFRKRFAGIGDYYSEELDCFLRPKPYESWSINLMEKDWESPLGPPPKLTQEQIDSGRFDIDHLTREEVVNLIFYVWDEDAYQADNTTGWVLTTLELPAE